MEIIHEIETLRARVKTARAENKSVGFVPTMGYLHEGHLSLLRKARNDNDLIILSVFVNPAQFGEGEDYEEYPRDLERDKKQAEKTGCDIIFVPAVKEMYPKGYASFVEVECLTENLCGASRPGHFRGVTTVVTKFFNIVRPDKAYFGQKDAQQAFIIKRMVKDLNMDLKVVIVPTVRDNDGLAMSSRNSYLSPEERREALTLSKALFEAEAMIKNGERNPQAVIDYINGKISSQPLAVIDYIQVVDTVEIKPVEDIAGVVLVAAAVKFGKTRLIDNIIVEV